jgi:hypothetical protein
MQLVRNATMSQRGATVRRGGMCGGGVVAVVAYADGPPGVVAAGSGDV